MPETRVVPTCYPAPPGPELHQKCGRTKITLDPFHARAWARARVGLVDQHQLDQVGIHDEHGLPAQEAGAVQGLLVDGFGPSLDRVSDDGADQAPGRELLVRWGDLRGLGAVSK